MTDLEDQEDELMALTSIYENVIRVSKEAGLNGGELMACQILPDDFIVKIVKHEAIKDSPNDPVAEEHKVQYLPPIALNFQLPVDYPSVSPPNFTLSCKWLNRQQLTKLCQKLDSLWEENSGSVILFVWNTFLQDELFDYLNLSSPLELADVIKSGKDSNLDKRAIQEISSQDQLLPVILEFNMQERLRQFERSSYTCKVCFCLRAGSGCMEFMECGHVYCNDCMKDYFSVQIQDGNVRSLECPDDKCETQAHPAQVKKLVSEELYARYDKLLLHTSLDMMKDVTYCPRPACRSPVLMEKDTTLASCPVCSFSFCILCKLVYHGVAPCKLRSDGLKELREEYLNADPATKAMLEKRYGKIILQQALEESYTNEWLNKNSKQCPDCGANIQKIDGCNKMTCMKCRAYFCWLCHAILSRGNPYSHYNTVGQGCFNKLFEGMDLDRFEDGGDFWDVWEDDL